MAARYEEIAELYADMEHQVTGDPTAWVGFLSSACRNFKCSFSEQLLIYAQRPDAVAVAELSTWNRIYRRWVNAGSKGIAVLAYNGQRNYVKYYFDVNDTHEGRNARPVNIWKAEKKYHEAIQTHLIDAFGEVKGADFSDILIRSAQNHVTDSIDAYYADLIEAMDGSLFSELPEEQRFTAFQTLLRDSVSYMLLERCGQNTAEYFQPADFFDIVNFNTSGVISVIGNATSTLSEELLREVTQAIRTFEKAEQQRYDEKNTTERSRQHEADSIYPKRRLSNPEPRLAEAGRVSPWKIRTNAGSLPEGASERNVHPSDDHLSADEASVRNRADRNSAGRPDDRKTGTTEQRDRTDESKQSDAVDSHDEQLPTAGRGADSAGADLQVSLFPTEEQQKQAIEAQNPHDLSSIVNEKPVDDTAFSFAPMAQRFLTGLSELAVPQAVIDDILRAAGNEQYSRKRIIYRYMLNTTAQSRAAFLQNEYKSGGRGFIINDTRYAVWWDTAGMKIAVGTHTADIPESDSVFLTWSQIEQRIGQLLSEGTYAVQEELDDARGRVLYEAAESLNFMYRDLSEETKQEYFSDYNLHTGVYPDTLNNVVTLMQDARFISLMVARLEDMSEEYKENPEMIRFQTHNPTRVLEEVKPLDEPYTPFLAQPDYAPAQHSRFITQDEVDAYLTKGGTYAEGRLRIYSFFTQEHTPKEKEQFLKERYGIGGFGRTGFSGSYDGKGIVLKRDMPDDPQAVEKLNWQAASKRITYLIEQKRFLKPYDYAQMVTFQRNRLAERINAFYMHLPEEIVRPFTQDFYAEQAKTELTEILKKRSSTQDLVAKMDAVFPQMPETVRYYDERKKTLADMHLYLDGNYTLFPKDAVTDIFEPEEHLSYHTETVEFIDAERANLPYSIEIQTLHIDEPKQEEQIPDYFIHRYYVVKDLNVAENLDIQYYDTLSDALRAYKSLPSDSLKALGIDKTPNPMPGSLDFIHCVDGQDTLVTDYLKVDGWQNPEILQAVEQINAELNRMRSENKIAGNYHIPSLVSESLSPKQRYHRNISAIQTLQRLQQENRKPTASEQAVLASYVGWGSLPQAFDSGNKAWSEEYETLKNLLSPEQYAAARASTLTAFYTPPQIIEAVYQVLDKLGFAQGNVLEPSCGIGNFFGLLPEKMQKSNLYGIELDSLTGQIAQKLYPDAHISIQGYEENKLPDGFFDVAVGNVPFGDFKVDDTRYNKEKFLIHDFFFSKALDQVRAGGVVAFVTSKGTMDKKDTSVRKYLAQRADLLGAIRLPEDIFKANAGTEVTSDIIFLQKRDHIIEAEPDWIHLDRDENGILMNRYFVQHPEMICGDFVQRTGRFGLETACISSENHSFETALQTAVQQISGRIPEREQPFADITQPPQELLPASPEVRNFSFVLVEERFSSMKTACYSRFPCQRLQEIVCVS